MRSKGPAHREMRRTFVFLGVVFLGVSVKQAFCLCNGGRRLTFSVHSEHEARPRSLITDLRNPWAQRVEPERQQHRPDA